MSCLHNYYWAYGFPWIFQLKHEFQCDILWLAQTVSACGSGLNSAPHPSWYRARSCNINLEKVVLQWFFGQFLKWVLPEPLCWKFFKAFFQKSQTKEHFLWVHFLVHLPPCLSHKHTPNSSVFLVPLWFILFECQQWNRNLTMYYELHLDRRIDGWIGFCEWVWAWSR